ncbi:MAG: hypothetical protein AAGA23_20760 [Pseudomonadota bacterium]
MKKIAYLALTALFIVSGAGAASIEVADGVSRPGDDLSGVNKSIRVGAGAEIGDVDSVNGSVRIDANAIVEDIGSVNGSIRLRAGVSAKSVESVNGGIELQEDVLVAENVESVNGRIRLERGTNVGQDVKTVNGMLDLTGVVVQGNVETYNGDMDLSETEVLGDLRVNKPRGLNWGGKKQKANLIRIGAGTVIHGDLYFDKAVRLSIDPAAKVGSIYGEKIERVDMR